MQLNRPQNVLTFEDNCNVESFHSFWISLWVMTTCAAVPARMRLMACTFVEIYQATVQAMFGQHT